MTFTVEVKKELTQLPPTSGALLALIRMKGSLTISGKLRLSISTENSATAQFIYRGLEELYDIHADIRIFQKENLAKNRNYTIYLDKGVKEFLDELSLADSLMLDNGIPSWIKLEKHLQRDYLRGAFLASGFILNPEKGYQLEISNSYQEHAEDLAELLTNFSFHPKILERKNRYILHLTQAEEISDFLTLIGAMQARLKFESVKIFNEMRGLANRQSNFESANISKIVSAAQEVILAIDKLISQSRLPEDLTDIAMARLNHPEASLEELGKLLDPVLSKSSVARRLTKLLKLANQDKV